MALRITRSLRMQAVSADLGYFPRARSWVQKFLMTGLLRTPATVAMYRTRRTWARPLPDTAAAVQGSAVAVKWRQSGQGGNLFAIKRAQLGQVGEQSTRKHLADTRHGTQQLVALRHRGVSRINSPSSSSKPDSRFSNQRMCSSMLRCK